MKEKETDARANLNLLVTNFDEPIKVGGTARTHRHFHGITRFPQQHLQAIEGEHVGSVSCDRFGLVRIPGFDSFDFVNSKQAQDDISIVDDVTDRPSETVGALMLDETGFVANTSKLAPQIGGITFETRRELLCKCPCFETSCVGCTYVGFSRTDSRSKLCHAHVGSGPMARLTPFRSFSQSLATSSSRRWIRNRNPPGS